MLVCNVVLWCSVPAAALLAASAEHRSLEAEQATHLARLAELERHELPKLQQQHAELLERESQVGCAALPALQQARVLQDITRTCAAAVWPVAVQTAMAYLVFLLVFLQAFVHFDVHCPS